MNAFRRTRRDAVFATASARVRVWKKRETSARTADRASTVFHGESALEYQPRRLRRSGLPRLRVDRHSCHSARHSTWCRQSEGWSRRRGQRKPLVMTGRKCRRALSNCRSADRPLRTIEVEDHHIADEVVARQLLVRRHYVPRRPGRTTFAKHVAIRSRVFIPARPFRQIARADRQEKNGTLAAPPF